MPRAWPCAFLPRTCGAKTGCHRSPKGEGSTAQGIAPGTWVPANAVAISHRRCEAGQLRATPWECCTNVIGAVCDGGGAVAGEMGAGCPGGDNRCQSLTTWRPNGRPFLGTAVLGRTAVGRSWVRRLGACVKRARAMQPMNGAALAKAVPFSRRGEDCHM